MLPHAASVEDTYGRPWGKEPSRFLDAFTDSVNCCDHQDIQRWLNTADWDRLVKADGRTQDDGVDSAIGALPLPAGLAEPARSVTTVLRKERCR